MLVIFQIESNRLRLRISRFHKLEKPLPGGYHWHCEWGSPPPACDGRELAEIRGTDPLIATCFRNMCATLVSPPPFFSDFLIYFFVFEAGFLCVARAVLEFSL